jgi:hypothetical protein
VSIFEKELTNEEKVLKALKNVMNLKEIGKNKVLISKYDLTIKFDIVRVKEYEKLIMAEVEFIIDHEFFGESLIEITAGVEEHIDEAIKQCVNNFYSSVLSVVIKALDNEYAEEFKSEFFGEKKNYKLTKGKTTNIGEREDNEEFDFWNLISEKTIDRLGNKKTYFIKVYASKIKSGDFSCECKINGIVDEDITNEIEDCVKNWKVKTNFYSLKQYFVITQEDSTYKKYPYNKEEIIGFSNKAMRILAECDRKEKFDNIDNEINKVTRNENVAYEIRSFIPEIICQLVFSDVHYSNNILLLRDDKQIKGYKGQFTIYYWIFESVVKAFNEKRLSEQELKTIIALSASYRVIAEALTSGRKTGELNNILFAVSGPMGYVPL